MIQNKIMLIYSQSLFAMTIFRNLIQDGTKFYYPVKDSFRRYLGKSVQIENTWVWSTQTVLELYDMEIHQKISLPNYQNLKTMVKRSADQKLWLRNFDARHGRIESGAVVKSRKGLIGIEGGKGICYQWEEKGQCSQGDRCSSRHETQRSCAKTQNTLPPRLLSQPYHEVELCQRREVSEAKVTLGPFFDNRADIIWEVPACERLANIDIRPNANSLKNETGCKAGDKRPFQGWWTTK